MNIQYRAVGQAELTPRLFAAFDRRQEVVNCYRRGADGTWCVRPDPFLDDWSAEDYRFLTECLIRTLERGGAVFGAFVCGALKGFCSVEAPPLGSRGQYRDLTSLHVSRELRGQGMGKELFALAAGAARRMGGEKLYISSHSAAETQAFYRGLGCTDASEPDAEHVGREPFDCQLEFAL